MSKFTGTTRAEYRAWLLETADYKASKRELLTPTLSWPVHLSIPDEPWPYFCTPKWVERPIFSKSYDEETLRAMFPFRSKADKSLMRCRLNDIVRLSHNFLLLHKLYVMDWDYVSATNALWFSYLLPGWEREWTKMRGFDVNPIQFFKMASSLSNILKTHVVTGCPTNIFYFFENGTVSGFRNPPFPGFNPIESLLVFNTEIEPLTMPDELYDDSLEHFFGQRPRPLKRKLTFYEFVHDTSMWATAGSSSLGKVYYHFDGKRYSFRANKKFAAATLDLDALYHRCLTDPTYDTVMFEKPELGKVRCAMSCPLHHYVRMKWILYGLNHVYRDWPAVTTEQKASEVSDRIITAAHDSDELFGGPVDFLTYDQKVAKKYNMKCMEHNYRLAATNLGDLPEFNDVVGISRKAMEHARVQLPDAKARPSKPLYIDYQANLKHIDLTSDQKYLVVEWLNGLLSGDPWTSVIGYQHSGVIMGTAHEAITEIGYRLIDPMSMGDDYLAWARRAEALIWLVAVATQMGAEFGKGKFSMQLGRGEYLRVWFQDGRAFGYPTRVSLTQRKPWNSTPWDPFSAWSGIYEALQTMKRRGADHGKCDTAWNYFLTRCSELNSIPVNWLGVPKNQGGPGLGQPTLGFRLSPPCPKIPTPELDFQNLSDNLADQLFAQASRFNIPINKPKSEISTQLANKMLVSDDVPNTLHGVRKAFNYAFKVWISQTKEKPVKFIPLDFEESPLRYSVAAIGSYSELLNTQIGARYGKYQQHLAPWRLLEYSDISRRTYFLEHDPTFWNDLNYLEKRFGFKRSEAVEWLTGSVSAPSFGYLHPMLMTICVHFACLSIAQNMACPDASFQQRLLWYLRHQIEAMHGSELAYTAFGW